MLATFATARDVFSLGMIQPSSQCQLPSYPIYLVSSHACDSPQYWKEMCCRYGKLLLKSDTLDLVDPNLCYKSLYFRNPCVPADFSTITEALTKVSKGGTITLMPGVYTEQLMITGEREVTIRAAKPDVGAALVHHVSRGLDDAEDGLGGPVVSIFDGAKVFLSYLQIIHSALTHDIIKSNVALLAKGGASELRMDSCTVQSDSGRGIVVYKNAALSLEATTVHDCAATGLWTHSAGRVQVSKCNFVRNGYFSEGERHSGIFAISGEIHVQDTLIASSALTGLSVVQEGLAFVSGCDIVGNGDEPLTIADPVIVRRGQDGVTVGVIVEGPVSNNTTWRPEECPTFGAPTQYTPFPFVLEHSTSTKDLGCQFAT